MPLDLSLIAANPVPPVTPPTPPADDGYVMKEDDTFAIAMEDGVSLFLIED